MLKRRIIANLGANGFAQLVNIITQLVAVPLFLYAWSKEHYGEWLLLSALPTYLSLAEAGFVSVSANKAAMLASAGKPEEVRRVLQTAWGFLLIMSGFLALLAAPAAFLVPWPRLLR